LASSETTFILMAIAVLISSIALLLSAFASVGTYLAVRKMQSQVSPLVPQVTEFLVNSHAALDEALKQFRETGDKTQAVLTDVRAEVASFSAARTDITDRLQAQVQRIELVLDDSLVNIQEIVSAVHGGVIKPIREVTGLVSGVRTAVRSFFSRRRPSVAQATQDEEIFIG
jgi:ABC-type transporter Mla subunit MlaD